MFEVDLIYFIYLSCTFPDINVTWYFLLWHFEENTLQKSWIVKLRKCSTVARSINSVLNSRWLSVDVIIVLRVLKLQNANKRITQTCCCYITRSCHLCQTNSKLVLLPWLDSAGPCKGQSKILKYLYTDGSGFLIWLFATWRYNLKTDETGGGN